MRVTSLPASAVKQTAVKRVDGLSPSSSISAVPYAAWAAYSSEVRSASHEEHPDCSSTVKSQGPQGIYRHLGILVKMNAPVIFAHSYCSLTAVLTFTFWRRFRARVCGAALRRFDKCVRIVCGVRRTITRPFLARS